jgi:hypothetical protein
MQKIAFFVPNLMTMAQSDATGIRIVRSTDGDRKKADASGDYLIGLSGSRRRCSHGGGGCAGNDEGEDEGVGNKLHGINSLGI